MATYFKRKSGWVARVRVTGHPEDTKSGFRTKEDAKAWAQTLESNLRRSRAVVGQGPTKTSLAASLLMYAHQVTTPGSAHLVGSQLGGPQRRGTPATAGLRAVSHGKRGCPLSQRPDA